MILRRPYLARALALFLLEAAIALWLDDPLVRPYVGDSLAVVLVHAVLRAATPLGSRTATLAALFIACAIEVSQRFHFVDAIGLGGWRVARIVLGTGYDARDFVAYAAGAGLIVAGEALGRRG